MSSGKLISSNKQLNEKIIAGVNVLADVVSTTLGPRGKTILIKNKDRKPIITKDGVSVARAITLTDPFEDLGAQVIKQSSEATLQKVGDGTTTSIVIAQAILQKAQPYIASGASPVELKKGIDKAIEEILREIEKYSMPISSIEQIEQIATISANGDKAIGKMIGVAVDKIGKDGSITIQEGRSTETTLDVSEGFTFDSGLLANAFINDERRQVMRYEDCLILVTDRNISTIDEILPSLEIASRDGRSFIIVAEQVEGQALAALIMNTAKGNMQVCAIKAPRYGEDRRNILDDIALITGAKFISRESGVNIRNVKLTDFGAAKIVEASKTHTTIVSNVSGREQAVNQRIEDLKQRIKETEDLVMCERIQDRITRLSSGIAIIKVGGATEVEMIEKKHRIEDALEAVKAAQENGIVAGGGTSLLRSSSAINVKVDNKDQQYGVDIVKEAVKEPFRKLVSNAGLSPDVLLNDILNESDWHIGYDVTTGTKINMIEGGILDPFKVVKLSLLNGASSASTLLSTSAAIVEI